MGVEEKGERERENEWTFFGGAEGWSGVERSKEKIGEPRLGKSGGYVVVIPKKS